MNINCKFSKIIFKFENHYKKYNALNSKYLIVKRECKHDPLGLFAYYITNLGWIEYAIRNNMIPVIDMKNFYNNFHNESEVGQVNTWEYFFHQPCDISLENALQSREARYVWNDIPEYQPNDSMDFLMNVEMIKYYRKLAKKYMPFKEDVIQKLQKENEIILGNSKNVRVLGVLARGTDYVSLKPHYHPIQPSIEQITEKINYYRKIYDCDKIYIATEDAGILKKMKEIYGNDLLYSNQNRVYPSKKFLNEDSEFNEKTPFERGMDYLQSIYTLSRCNGIIAGRTSGTVGAVILADNYDFQYFFSLGRYGIEDKIMKGDII